MPSKPPQKPLPSTKRKSTATAASPPLPNWPALSPLVPSEDLHLETLLEGQVIIIRNLLTSALCHKYLQFLSSLPLVTTPVTPKDGDALRVNDRFEVQDGGFAQRLWNETGLEGLVTGRAGAGEGGYGGVRGDDGDQEEREEVDKNVMGDLKTLWGGEFLSLALILAWTLYCFSWVCLDILLACSELMEPIPMAGMYFLLGPEFMDVDAVLQEIPDTLPSTYNPAVGPWMFSVLAFLLWALPDWVVAVDSDRFLGQFDVVYVNDPTCTGGETVFYPDDPPLSSSKKSSSRLHPTTSSASSDPLIVAPEPGMALLHKHGLQDCLLHEGRPVLGGEKWVLRSDLCVLR
ncbi:hypothetical protein MMC22_008769 [Lobaria immixta]|nr:hypothetical protein [Lobaria immixta]